MALFAFTESSLTERPSIQQNLEGESAPTRLCSVPSAYFVRASWSPSRHHCFELYRTYCPRHPALLGQGHCENCCSVQKKKLCGHFEGWTRAEKLKEQGFGGGSAVRVGAAPSMWGLYPHCCYRRYFGGRARQMELESGCSEVGSVSVG